MKENKLDCLVGINQRGLSSKLTRQQRSDSLPAHLCDFELEKNIFLLKPTTGRERKQEQRKWHNGLQAG
jgi:hypothetical protein